MIRLEIDGTKFNRFTRSFNMSVKQHPQQIEGALRKWAKHTVGEARMNVSGRILDIRTGKLFRSIGIHGPITRSKNSMSVKVGSRMPGPVNYGAVWERGIANTTVIVPKDAKALSWVSETTGERIFAKRVVRPPQPARPWMKPALKVGKRHARRYFKEAYAPLGKKR